MNYSKRLGIFVFYDRDGIVDEYVLGLLEDLSGHLSRLVVVCNGNVEQSGQDALKKIADEVYLRENSGFDAMAFRHGLLECVGREEVEKYDEVILCNDTFYGPIYPFASVFDKMESADVDFWGLSSVGEMPDDEHPGRMFPAYIQSFFMAFRKKVLQSEDFWQYWECLDTTQWCFSRVYREHEFLFTQFLEKLGMKWDCFVPKNESRGVISTFDENYELIVRYRYPVLKRKAFIRKCPDRRGGADIRKTYDYIRENGLYDTDLIWDNLLRLYSKRELWEAMHLDYVIDTKQGSGRTEKETEKNGDDVFVCSDLRTECEKADAVAASLFESAVFEKYIRPIFEENKRLGQLVIPRDIYAEMFCHIADGIDEDRCLGVWKRKNREYKSYYTGRLMTKEMVQLRLHNVEYVLKELYEHFLVRGEIRAYTDIFRQDLVAFFGQCKEIYVYGAGDYGNEAVMFLKENGMDICGYIVSDGQPRQTHKNGKRVVYLSEFTMENPAAEEIGIVIALMPKYRESVRRELEQKGYTNLFILR